MTKPVSPASVERSPNETNPGQRDRTGSSDPSIQGVPLIAAYGYVALAILGNDDAAVSSTLDLVFWYGAFLSRTFAFHAGIGFAVLALITLLRRRFKTAAALLPALAFLFWPVLQSWIPRHTTDDAANSFRVMTVNLFFRADPIDALLSEIDNTDPDVLVMQEYTWRWHEGLLRTIGDRFPHRVLDVRDDAFGAAIYSKFPIIQPAQADFGAGLGKLAAPRAVLDVDGRAVAVYGVHMFPPFTRRVAFMKRQLEALLKRLREESHPVIVAGDFNFTDRSRMHARICGLGLVDAHTAAGHGRGATWPNRGPLSAFPKIRIDHVFTGYGLSAIRCAAGTGQGSDHRPVIVDVGWTDDVD